MLTGIDVSHHQGSIDWSKVRGVDFAVCKATQGTSMVDPMFHRNWAGIKAAGIKRSAYHFASPGHGSAHVQAEHFASTVGPVDDLPLVLDLEDTDLSPSATTEWGVQFLTRLDELTGRRSIIYTGPGFINGRLANAARLTPWPLWVAHYTQAPAPHMAPWSQWLWWQHTDSGSVPGIAGHVDMNRGQGLPKPPTPQPHQEDDVRAIIAAKSKPRDTYITDGMAKRRCGPSQIALFVATGIVASAKTVLYEDDAVNAIPTRNA